MSHTPGRWRIVPWFDEKAVIVVGDEQVDLVIAKVEDKIDSADARLIAAAPDLLAACEDAVMLIADGKCKPGENPYHVIGRLRQAVAKAAGKP